MTGAALRVRFLLLGVLLAAAILGSFLIGRYDLSVGDMLYALAGRAGLVSAGHSPAATVLELRFPRIAGAALVGAALSVSGAAYQFMYRNPMVSLATRRHRRSVSMRSACALSSSCVRRS